MATKIDHPVTFVPSFEKVLSQNTQFAERFLGAFKKIITTISTLPETAKNEVREVTEVTTEYLKMSLGALHVTLPNIHELGAFLVKHVDSIQPLIAVCNEVTQSFPEKKGLSLVYEVETEDSSGVENITLYIEGLPFTSNSYKQISAIEQKYIDYFIDSEILFTIQLDKTHL